MGAIDKTEGLRRENLSIGDLEPDPDNPNKMSSREFDLLVQNMEEQGLTDPILVWEYEKNKYRVVGGHHRLDAAKYLGMMVVPCTVIDDPDFTEEMAQFQLVRHNVIKGKLDPDKFLKLYGKVAKKYEDALLQDMFGFADEAEFRKLVQQTAKSLPKEMQAAFKEAAKEIKTIDGLARLLNEMFTKFGDTLPYGYMIVDYGGHESIWLRVSKKTYDDVLKLGATCVENGRTMDDLMGYVVSRMASGDLDELLQDAVNCTPAVTLPSLVPGQPPTKDEIEAAEVI